MEIEKRYDGDYDSGEVTTDIVSDSQLVLRVRSVDKLGLDSEGEKRKFPLWIATIETNENTPEEVLESFSGKMGQFTYTVDFNKDVIGQMGCSGYEPIGVPMQHEIYVDRIVGVIGG